MTHPSTSPGVHLKYGPRQLLGYSLIGAAASMVLFGIFHSYGTIATSTDSIVFGDRFNFAKRSYQLHADVGSLPCMAHPCVPCSTWCRLPPMHGSSMRDMLYLVPAPSHAWLIHA